MDLDPEYDDLVRRDATVLLRPRTGLKDMFLALDPGTRGRARGGGGRDDRARPTPLPDVNADEILAGARHRHARLPEAADQRRGQGARRAAADDLREVFAPARPAAPRPRPSSTARWSSARRNLARLIHNYGSTVEPPGQGGRRRSRRWCSDADRVFDRLAQEDAAHLARRSRGCPSTLRQTERTLRQGATSWASVAGPGVRGAAPRGAPGRLRQQRAAAAGRDGRADPAQAGAPVRAARRGPTCATCARPPRNLGTASPDLRESLLRAQPLLQHGRLQPGRAPRG